MHVIIPGKPDVDPGLADGQVLWRYLDVAKFLDFIHNHTLFFTRGDQFEDKFEGAFTKSVRQAIKRSYEINNINFTFEDFKKRLRERVFLNCWHANQDDSMAMWTIYGRSASAVAVTTTVRQLREAIKAANLSYNVSIARVQYVKHWRDPKLQISPYARVFAYKVKAYEFEKEVRVIIDRFHEDFDSAVVEVGMSVKIALGTLLRSIVVGPEAPAWFYDLVEGIAEKYSVDAPIRRSKLATTPI